MSKTKFLCEMTLTELATALAEEEAQLPRLTTAIAQRWARENIAEIKATMARKRDGNYAPETMALREAVATVEAYEAGTLIGPGAEQKAAEALALRERSGRSATNYIRLNKWS